MIRISFPLTMLALCSVAIVIGCNQRTNSNGSSGNNSTVDEMRLEAGEALYTQHCATCHMADGSGAPPMNPPIVKTSFVLGDESQLIAIVLNGMKGVEVDGEKYKNVMPGFAYLNDQEIADVLTYVRNSFGNKASAVSLPGVAAARSLGNPQ